MTHPTINEESTLMIHAYLDGELDPINALAVEKRMETDSALAAECERVESLQRLMREHLPREVPPPGLRARVDNVVGLRHSSARFTQTHFSWRALAASIAVTAFVASTSTSMLLGPSRSSLVRDGIVDAHLRSLMAPQPIDVASSDQHTAPALSILPRRDSHWSADGSTSLARFRYRRWSTPTGSISLA